MDILPQEMPETPDTQTDDLLKTAAERDLAAAAEMRNQVLGDLASRATSEASAATGVFINGVMALQSELDAMRDQ